MSDKTTNPIEIEESKLDEVEGGLLLPAVQKVREAAARMSTTTTAPPAAKKTVLGDGSV